MGQILRGDKCLVLATVGGLSLVLVAERKTQRWFWGWTCYIDLQLWLDFVHTLNERDMKRFE